MVYELKRKKVIVSQEKKTRPIKRLDKSESARMLVADLEVGEVMV